MYINKDNVLLEYERIKTLVTERKSEFCWTAHMCEDKNRREELPQGGN